MRRRRSSFSHLLRAAVTGFLCGQLVLAGRPWRLSGPRTASAELPPPEEAAPAPARTAASDTAAPAPAAGFRHGVDPSSGTWQGTIPIVTPPGRRGVQPRLALVYGSATNQQGLAGAGWDLPVSTVRLEPSPDDTPRYTLDGQRLVWWGDDTFDVERDSRLRVRRDCNTCAFLVDSPDGTRVRLGHNPDARVPWVAWAVDRVEDAHGNYMTFSYMTDADLAAQLGAGWTRDGALLPKEIRYTGSATRSPWYAVRFDYALRPAGDGTYVQPRTAAPADGALARSRYRLRAIRVVGGDGVEIRRYTLHYGSSSSGHSVLHSVEQTGLQGEAGPGPYQLAYTQTAAGFAPSAGTGASSEPRRTVTGDFDRDGRTDLLEYLPLDGTMPFRWTIRRGTAAGFAPRTPWLDGHRYDWSGRDRVYVGDWDADGDSDVLHVDNEVDSARWWILRADGDHFTRIEWRTPADVPQDGPLDLTDGDGETVAALVFADFTGDGRADAIVHRTEERTGVGVENLGPQPGAAQALTGVPDAWLVDVADVNGDRKLDLVFRTPGDEEDPDDDQLTIACAGWGARHFGPCRTPRPIAAEARTLTGDWNGDGFTDLLVRAATADDPHVPSTILWSGPGDTDAATTTIPVREKTGVADVDGDGRDDLVRGQQPGTSGYELRTWLARGDTFTAGPSTTLSWGYHCHTAPTPRSGDVTGDGRTDVIVTPCGASPTLVPASAAPPAERLASMSTPTGLLVELDHARSSAADNPALPVALPVVAELRTRDFPRPTAEGTVNPLVETHRYRYFNGLWDVARGEPQGFAQVWDQTVERNLETRTWFHQDLARRGKPDWIATARSAPLATLTVDSYRYHADASRPYHTPVAWHARSYWEDETITAWSLQGFLYDADGNPTRADDHGLCSTTDDDRHTRTTFVAATGRYLVRSAQQELWTGALEPPLDLALQTGCAGSLDEARLVEATRNTYDDAPGQLVRGDLTQQDRLAIEPDGSTQWMPWRAATYRADGLPATLRDARGNTTTIVAYDPVLDTHPAVVRNPLGHEVTREYQAHLAVPWRVIDANGGQTFLEHDGFGRPRAVYTPESIATGMAAVAYRYGDGWPSWTATIRPFVDADGTVGRAASVELRDALGRAYLTVADGDAADERVASGFTTYWAGSDRPARLAAPIEVPVPACGADTCLATDALAGTLAPLALAPPPGPTAVFTYDPLGRAVRRDNPDGSFVSYVNPIDARGFGTVATDEVGDVHGVFRDARGAIARVERASGTTLYRHDARGKLTAIQTANGVKTLLDWDSRGRLAHVHSPAVGDLSLAYDDDGHEVERIDARGVVTTTEVDALGRPLVRTSGADVTRWAYDRTPLCAPDCTAPPPAGDLTLGRPWAVADAAGVATFAYDGDGHVRRETRTIGAMALTTTYQTWPTGEVIAKVWPNGDLHRWALAPDGRPSELWTDAGAAPLVTARRDALGRPASLLYASGARTDYHVDPLTLRIDAIETRDPGGDATLELAYGYRDDGVPDTFSHRDEHGGDEKRHLVHDADKRLTHVYLVTDPLQPAEQYGYDADGNMIERQDRGGSLEPVAHDDPAHPEATTGYGKRSYAYDASGNRTEWRLKGDLVDEYHYDGANRLVEVTGSASATYAYDADGRRVIETLPAGTRVTVGGYTLDIDGSKRTALRLGGLAVGERSTLHGDRFFHADLAGSLVGESNDQGELRGTRTYAAFGATVDERGGFVSRTGFGGYALDDTGLYFANARYYDPATASFTQPDTWLYGFDTPEALSAYAYGANSPYRYADPSGHELVTLLATFAISFGIRLLAEWAGSPEGTSWSYIIGKSFLLAALHTIPIGLGTPLFAEVIATNHLDMATILVLVGGSAVASVAEQGFVNHQLGTSGGYGKAVITGVLTGIGAGVVAWHLAGTDRLTTFGQALARAGTAFGSMVITAGVATAEATPDPFERSSSRIRYDAPGVIPAVPSCGRGAGGSMPVPCEALAR